MAPARWAGPWLKAKQFLRCAADCDFSPFGLQLWVPIHGNRFTCQIMKIRRCLDWGASLPTPNPQRSLSACLLFATETQPLGTHYGVGPPSAFCWDRSCSQPLTLGLSSLIKTTSDSRNRREDSGVTLGFSCSSCRRVCRTFGTVEVWGEKPFPASSTTKETVNPMWLQN